MISRAATPLLSMAAIWLLALLLPLQSGAMDYSDLRGPYCETRRDGCCSGRQDGCSVPIIGTLCYCDDFCNRTRSEDCCPDFWSHCKGISPPETTGSCYYNGKYYKYGQTVKVNCNLCKCQEMAGRIELLCERNDCLVEPEVIAAVNSGRKRLGWRASNYTAFWGHRLDEGISMRLGTLVPHKAVLNMKPVKNMNDRSRLPRSFDSRSKWRGLLQGVKDQGWCGSSWALSTTAVASDRFAIMSQGEEAVQLSTQHLLSCNNRGQRGCQGGHLDRAWTFLRKFGLVDEPCYPYEAGSGDAGRCRLPKRGNLLTARCATPMNPLRPPRKDLYRVGPAYRLGKEEDIMHEIMESGPIQATMKVYQDFFMYRGGVYKHSSEGAVHRTGYHSVRVVGWGVDVTQGPPIKYWLVANSWGDLWGENGYFRILRGSNECEIETFVLAVWAETFRPNVRHSNINDNRLSNNI